MWWQGGREGGGGGNSPAHLLSFSARFYPAEFLWQPLKKRCAVNCGFEMRCLIALCGGDGWLFRQPSSVRGNWWRAPMKQHSICFLWCVCQSLVLQHVCAWRRVGGCMRAHAEESFTLESSAPCRAARHSWHPPDCTQLSKRICLADHVDSSVCFGFQLMESVPLMTIHLSSEFRQRRTMQPCVFWFWKFWRMAEETHKEDQHNPPPLLTCLFPLRNGATSHLCMWLMCTDVRSLTGDVCLYLCKSWTCMLFSVSSPPLSLWVAVWCL